jgi:hypothetical protein
MAEAPEDPDGLQHSVAKADALADNGDGDTADENETEGHESDEEEDDDEDEDDEPKLKYARLTGSLGQVYRNGDATSTFLVAGDKMVC